MNAIDAISLAGYGPSDSGPILTNIKRSSLGTLRPRNFGSLSRTLSTSKLGGGSRSLISSLATKNKHHNDHVAPEPPHGLENNSAEEDSNISDTNMETNSDVDSGLSSDMLGNPVLGSSAASDSGVEGGSPPRMLSSNNLGGGNTLSRGLSSSLLGRGRGLTGATSLSGPGGLGRGRSLSLSIDASMKVLRQALLFRSALLKQREQMSRARQNQEILQTIGKRSAPPIQQSTNM